MLPDDDRHPDDCHPDDQNVQGSQRQVSQTELNRRENQISHEADAEWQRHHPRQLLPDGLHEHETEREQDDRIDTLGDALLAEGIQFLPSVPKIGRSKLHMILTDRSYIGEIKFRGQWHPGTHTPLVEPKLWDRVQTLLGQKVYKQHQMTYASDLIECAHCGSPITGERKTKMITLPNVESLKSSV